MESEARATAERDFIEMSAAGKTRLLYLEQWKAGASTRLFRLQERLDISVPEEVSLDASQKSAHVMSVIIALYYESLSFFVDPYWRDRTTSGGVKQRALIIFDYVVIRWSRTVNGSVQIIYFYSENTDGTRVVIDVLNCRDSLVHAGPGVRSA